MRRSFSGIIRFQQPITTSSHHSLFFSQNNHSVKMYTSILIALAAIASAMPAPQVTVGSGPDPKQEFALAVRYNGIPLSLFAVNNGTDNERVLVAERLSAYPGTPAFANVQDGGRYTSVNLDIDGESFGLVVKPVGTSYGDSTTVLAKKNTQEFGWSIKDGLVDHARTGPFNFFYLCKDTVNDQEVDVLKWVNANYNTTAPEGCVYTQIYQNCNVDGSEYKC
ncbi:uncharacterized protein K489DRAFT_435649 [Dissoconium aciculare CBS 342.82]|uniref:DUF7907 domain-containing protein n=1 Tax=Dissoconium aciculare CBS 342.82 TaxID=1314786 RepID=A0A6J3LP54_9PEZI|nr:uncharacterized protein K489DRAFT_435649 [Dissoconium aciculare CBS 342.82]KAF1817746.1 hypothetical protein K489DRAFT_435649 [Dissoconium aciculare CBS 342.82]